MIIRFKRMFYNTILIFPNYFSVISFGRKCGIVVFLSGIQDPSLTSDVIETSSIIIDHTITPDFLWHNTKRTIKENHYYFFLLFPIGV